MAYNAETVAQYFDALAEKEWLRLESTLQGRIKYAVHRRFIAKHIRPAMHVLDVGSGPGRFALDCAELGADVTLVDISPVQLELARERLAAAGAMQRVRAFHRLDVLDLTSLAAESYDAVVCFGGAVSYTRERYRGALRQLVRVQDDVVSMAEGWKRTMGTPRAVVLDVTRMGNHAESPRTATRPRAGWRPA